MYIVVVVSAAKVQFFLSCCRTFETILHRQASMGKPGVDGGSWASRIRLGLGFPAHPSWSGASRLSVDWPPSLCVRRASGFESGLNSCIIVLHFCPGLWAVGATVGVGQVPHSPYAGTGWDADWVALSVRPRVLEWPERNADAKEVNHVGRTQGTLPAVLFLLLDAWVSSPRVWCTGVLLKSFFPELYSKM